MKYFYGWQVPLLWFIITLHTFLIYAEGGETFQLVVLAGTVVAFICSFVHHILNRDGCKCGGCGC